MRSVALRETAGDPHRGAKAGHDASDALRAEHPLARTVWLAPALARTVALAVAVARVGLEGEVVAERVERALEQQVEQHQDVDQRGQ